MTSKDRTAKSVRVGVIGASGYTGAELMRLIAGHPAMELVYATGDSKAGTLASSLYPGLALAYPDLVFADFNVVDAEGLDVVFLGLPHEAAIEVASQLAGKVGCIVDLSAAFRLKDASLYPTWYGFDHTKPEMLKDAVYGLPELNRSAIKNAKLIATPGCYVTAASIALTPLVSAGLIDKMGVIVDAASGVSGAGRALKDGSLFCSVDEDFNAYGLLDHRHTPEIEQVTGAQILFTPHLTPMNRGILATCYARPAINGLTTAKLLAELARFYENEPFVSVRTQSPSTKATLGTNAMHLTARFDDRTGYAIVICALDNLCKGASGGAVQSANIALGLEESSGLSNVGMYP